MVDPDEHQPGQVLLGKLEVIRRIGGGGMGVVYEVEHRLTGHRRALKVVRARYADRPRFMKRLLREAKVAGTLGTPHVVETYDA
ncbi:MAG: serine/threonine protein kinase, partial [Myxococcales bacterium]|nr:serine/threonine protein kinase [Myxococcales bacterium]